MSLSASTESADKKLYKLAHFHDKNRLRLYDAFRMCEPNPFVFSRSFYKILVFLPRIGLTFVVTGIKRRFGLLQACVNAAIPEITQYRRGILFLLK